MNGSDRFAASATLPCTTYGIPFCYVYRGRLRAVPAAASPLRPGGGGTWAGGHRQGSHQPTCYHGQGSHIKLFCITTALGQRIQTNF